MTYRLYQKKPVIVKAWQVTAENIGDVADWCGGLPFWPDPGSPYITIPTLDGGIVADLGDWMIESVSGGFYSCKASSFEVSYDPALTSDEIQDILIEHSDGLG